MSTPDSSEKSPSRSLPVWALSPREEKEAYKNWKKSAYEACDQEVRDFSLCAKEAGVSVTFTCRDLHKRMYSCIERFQTYENLDKEFDKVIAKKRERLSESQKK